MSPLVPNGPLFGGSPDWVASAYALCVIAVSSLL